MWFSHHSKSVSLNCSTNDATLGFDFETIEKMQCQISGIVVCVWMCLFETIALFVHLFSSNTRKLCVIVVRCSFAFHWNWRFLGDDYNSILPTARTRSIPSKRLRLFSWWIGRIWNRTVCRRVFGKRNRFSLFSSPFQVVEKRVLWSNMHTNVCVERNLGKMLRKFTVKTRVLLRRSNWSCLESGLIETTKEPLCVQSAFQRMAKIAIAQ